MNFNPVNFNAVETRYDLHAQTLEDDVSSVTKTYTNAQVNNSFQLTSSPMPQADRLEHNPLERLEKEESLVTKTLQTTQSEEVEQPPIARSSVQQLPVLPQQNDETGNEENSCGFHAVKNILILLLSQHQDAESQNLLKNANFFRKFYDYYCIPHMNGQQDATLPTIVRNELHGRKTNEIAA